MGRRTQMVRKVRGMLLSVPTEGWKQFLAACKALEQACAKPVPVHATRGEMRTLLREIEDLRSKMVEAANKAGISV